MPACEVNGCATALTCHRPSGICITDLTLMPKLGNVAACAAQAPSWECHGAACSQMVEFLPRSGEGYLDAAVNGETSNNHYRSWVQEHLKRLVQFTAAQVKCLTQDWPLGNRQPITLGDMSYESGEMPTTDGLPDHPAGFHFYGQEMDISYYQLGPDNTERSVCTHIDPVEGDVGHCLTEAGNLDLWRTALFIALLHTSPWLSAVGVDGRIGTHVVAAIELMCERGWLPGNRVCEGPAGSTDRSHGNVLIFVTEDDSSYSSVWYRHLFHHFHISTRRDDDEPK